MAYDEKNLGRGEKIVYYAHRHYFVLLRNAAQWIALFIFALVITIFFVTLKKENDTWGTLGNVAMIAGLVGMFVGLIGFAIAFLLWKTEEYIITNERILRIEGIVNKDETATALEKVNDVETHQSLIGRMFGYGNVTIQTGSDQGINRLDFLAKPQEFKKIMLNAKNKIYGDASDFSPSGRVYEDENGNPRQVRPQVQVYDVPPPQPQPRYQQSQYYDTPQARPQGQYYEAPAQAQPNYNDPRGGYAPRPQPQMQSQGPTSAAQIAEAIQQLARLRDSGAISEAEFQAKKNDLMNRM